jgi:hypothetical protein
MNENGLEEPAGPSDEAVAKATRVLEQVRGAWLKRPGVSGVDLGFKWTGGAMTDELSIRVHVVRKKDRAELSPAELFPADVKGIPVDVIEATYRPQTQSGARLESASESRGLRYDVVPIGVSVGSRYTTAGTLGAKVIDVDTGEEMILSNWHVLAGRREAAAGLAIWQPGWIDGGTREENTIAQLSRWVLGPYDAAVARVNGTRTVESSTVEGKTVDDVTGPRLGMRVWKSGRSTGYTEGLIDGIMMSVPMSYELAGTHILEHVFRIVPRPGAADTEISEGGDSGALWVDEQSGKAVGLHFAGEVGDDPEYALAHDIRRVLEKLRVRLPAQQPDPSGGKKPGQTRNGSGNGQRNYVELLAALAAFFRHYLKR